MLSLLEKRPWLIHTDYKLPWSINYPSFPAFQLLRDAAAKMPDKAATWFYGSEITFWDLYLTCLRMANGLKELGVEKGDRVGILLPNCPQFLISFWSTMAIGAIAVNLNPMYTLDELRHCQKITEMKCLVTFDLLIPLVEALNKDESIPNVIVTKLSDYINGMGVTSAEGLGLEPGWHHFSTFIDNNVNTDPPRVNIHKDDPALIQFTGGTTGTPKGATLTNQNLVAATYQVVLGGSSLLDEIPAEKRVVLTTLPLFHVYGEICCMGYGLLSTATNILMPKFDIDEIFDAIANFERITYWPAVPTMLTAVFHHPRAKEENLGKKILFVGNGAAPCPLNLIEKAKDMHVYLSEGWGMSETTSLGIGNPCQGIKKPLSIGIPAPDADVRLVDPETLQDVALGERGEIWIKGPTVMKGYWNNPEETANQLRDGWLRTGDVAYQDEDYYIFIVDRTKDLIIAGGYNIYPRDIDDVLLKHPQVKDAITIGIPDDYRGETVKSFVQLAEGSSATEAELIAFCREHLAAYKVPRMIEFRPELPRTQVGKALRRQLRDEELEKSKSGKCQEPGSEKN